MPYRACSLKRLQRSAADAYYRKFFTLATIFVRLKRLQTHGTATHFANDDRPRPRHHCDGDA